VRTKMFAESLSKTFPHKNKTGQHKGRLKTRDWKTTNEIVIFIEIIIVLHSLALHLRPSFSTGVFSSPLCTAYLSAL